MFIPETINNNILAVYHSTNKKNTKRLLKSEDFTKWSLKFPKTLRKLCLDVIITNWTENPIINEIQIGDDARYILDHLSTEIPFKLSVEYIHDELYWKRAFRTRWPGKMLPEKPHKLDYEIPNQCKQYKNIYKYKNIKNHDEIIKLNTWKCFYIERHLQNILEHLKPEEYNAFKMKDLIELSKDYIIRLKLNQLQAPIEHDKERIPLHAILPALANLKQLTMCFKQTYAGDDFSWHILQTTEKDIENLSRGLKGCDLHILRLINTDINCNKVTMIVYNLQSNWQLQILDFSHCKIGDNGIVAICKLLLELNTLKELNLMNNFIETKGIEILSFTLSKSEVKLEKLDLSLNNLEKCDTGILSTMLCNNNNLTNLCLSACGLTQSTIRLLIKSLEINKSLQVLDLCNNKLDEIIGKELIDLFESNKNTTFKTIDLRMTKIPMEIILEIEDLLQFNWRNKIKKQQVINDNEEAFFSSNTDNTLDLETISSKQNISTEEDLKTKEKNFFPEFNINELETKLENVFKDYLFAKSNKQQDEEEEDVEDAEDLQKQNETSNKDKVDMDNDIEEIENVLKC